ncbi:G0/G1 switch protein 2 [Protopterus annectens]|uniref:G0/G1 switch protein 2 n=1 Tax=Protopterus annectens TaxID=7888 RepID=UPI001CF951C3|nr:G0/G1 switch protein 2 [Protopterus annectens]
MVYLSGLECSSTCLLSAKHRLISCNIRLEVMETMHELIPFAREMLSQKPNRKMVKMYVVGSVLAFFGVVIGLMETVCQPFAAPETSEEEEDTTDEKAHMTEVQIVKKQAFGKEPENKQAVRNSANRLHAS